MLIDIKNIDSQEKDGEGDSGENGLPVLEQVASPNMDLPIKRKHSRFKKSELMPLDEQ